MADESAIRLKSIRWRTEPSGSFNTILRPYSFLMEAGRTPPNSLGSATPQGAMYIKGEIRTLGYDDHIAMMNTTDGNSNGVGGVRVELEVTFIEEDGTSRVLTVNNMGFYGTGRMQIGNKSGIKVHTEGREDITMTPWYCIIDDNQGETLSDYVNIA